MFRTADGHTLELSPWRMRRLARLVAEARRHPAGAPSRSIAQDIRQLMARARRVVADGESRIARFETSGACCRACFLARQRAGGMDIVAVRVTPSVHLYENAPREFEFESMPKSANLVLKWRRYGTLETAERHARGPGVYILMRDNVAVYVGKSEHLEERLGERRLCEQQHGASGLSVWVATVPARADIRAVEHVVVRALSEPLTNTQLKTPMRVGNKGLDIRRVLPAPLRSTMLVRKRAVRAPGDTFEIAP
jgi:hypothetical protein